MKKILTAGCLLLSFGVLKAQDNKGLVSFERVSQVQIRLSGGAEGMESMLPKTRTDKFELSFGNNQSLWKAAEDDNGTNDIRGGDGGGMQIHMIVAGADDVLFTNFEAGKRVEKRELFGKTFIIDDTISKTMKWKMSNETKSILGYPCMKATSTSIRTRHVMNIENGVMEKKDIQDTSNIVAWFTTSIPVSAGPAEYQGQLPGLILEMDIKDGTQVYKATGISNKVDVATIKEPSGKKHLTPDEFKKEREKMMDEMQKNNQGGGQRVIRMN